MAFEIIKLTYLLTDFTQRTPDEVIQVVVASRPTGASFTTVIGKR